jgi:hypothetical protein
MGYALMGLIGFGLGFVAGAVYVYIFGEKTAETRPEEDTDRTSADCNNTREN